LLKKEAFDEIQTHLHDMRQRIIVPQNTMTDENALTFVLNVLVHTVQLKGLASECILTCSLTCPNLLNSLPHLPHLKFRSSWWLSTCLLRESLEVKALSQSVHLCGR